MKQTQHVDEAHRRHRHDSACIVRSTCCTRCNSGAPESQSSWLGGPANHNRVGRRYRLQVSVISSMLEVSSSTMGLELWHHRAAARKASPKIFRRPPSRPAYAFSSTASAFAGATAIDNVPRGRNVRSRNPQVSGKLAPAARAQSPIIWRTSCVTSKPGACLRCSSTDCRA